MANKRHLTKLKEGVGAWNIWRSKNPDVRLNLFGADLSGAILSKADLSNADLVAANLNGANLSEANLRRAELDEADLSRADLGDADLTRAKLDGANLSEANLSEANLRRAELDEANLRTANFRSADLTNADFYETVFSDTDLRDVQGLDTCRHLGPSIIDRRTLARSGPLPLVFLRGCGLSDTLIEYLPSLLNQPIQFYSCFISYSTKDQEFADRLYADLQNKGVRCWFAPHDVQGGKKLHEQIDEAIRRYERLLLILSPNSMSSKWVKTEIRNAHKREVAEKKRVLFPVRLASYEALREWKLFDGDEGEDLATEIREYYIPDFSEWKNHDLYAREFEKLLRDLRTDGASAVERIP